MNCPKCNSSNTRRVSSWDLTPTERSMRQASAAWHRIHPAATVLGGVLSLGVYAAKGVATDLYHCNSCVNRWRKLK